MRVILVLQLFFALDVCQVFFSTFSLKSRNLGCGIPPHALTRLNLIEGLAMAQKKPDLDTVHAPRTHASQPAPIEDDVPVMQKILDNPFLLLFLGVVMPTVFYIIWGVMEIVTIPIVK
jgi:hypothetical protein